MAVESSFLTQVIEIGAGNAAVAERLYSGFGKFVSQAAGAAAGSSQAVAASETPTSATPPEAPTGASEAPQPL